MELQAEDTRFSLPALNWMRDDERKGQPNR
jgi:hypothetical protein